MRTVEELFPSRSLKAADLKDAALVVTIVHVEEQIEVGEKKDRKVGLVFAETPMNDDGTPKMFAANKTNCNTIATLHGNRPLLWKGKKIIIYPTETSMAGVMKPCIRVKTVAPPQDTVSYQPTPPMPASAGGPVNVGGGVG